MASWAELSSQPAPAASGRDDFFTTAKPPTPPTPTLKSIDKYTSAQVSQLPMLGKIPYTAYSMDNRFCSCLYIPRNYSSLQSLRLIVLVHSSDREAARLRDDFIDLAEEYGCALVAPLFPQGLVDPNDNDNYKMLAYKGIRFDSVLLGIVADAGQRWPKIDTRKVFMQGFSGGGQFVHRFAYLHPHRLEAIVVGAPGSITPLDTRMEGYPKGLKDIRKRFGAALDLEALKSVDVLFVVGELDVGVEHLVARGWRPEDCKNRRQILGLLENSWRAFGIPTRLELVPGVRHEGSKTNKCAAQFFAAKLSQCQLA